MSPPLEPSNPSLLCDVLVVGGGAAGCAAAVAAGRAGARVVLLEHYGFLGGLATASEVGTICGLYLRDANTTAPSPVTGGFPLEFAARIEKAGARGAEQVGAGLWILPYLPPVFHAVADAILRETPGLRLLLHTTVAGIETSGRAVSEVRGLAWNEALQVKARAVVDATGEASVARLAGAAGEPCEGEQAPALVFSLDSLSHSLLDGGWIEIRRALREGVGAGTLPTVCERLALVPGTGHDGRGVFKLNLAADTSGRPLWDQVTTWEREGRALVREIHRYLAHATEICAQARLASIAPQVGVRSGWRLRGRARLTDDEVRAGRKHGDGIARGAWPIERWRAGARPELSFFGERDYYEIPLDCLRPTEFDNLFCAGRCFSAEPAAMSSARVIGTALATGWAAGTAAAFQALGRPMGDAVDQIRSQAAV